MKISMSLSLKSIHEAIEQLEQYKEKFYNKNDEFVRRLAELGIPVIDQNIAMAQGDSSKEHDTYIKIDSFEGYSQATLTLQGKDIAFIEFGAGVYYNGEAGSSPNPKGKEFGYTIGSYGKGHGKQETWGYYADTGELILSHGTEATMPLYSASIEILQNIRRIAKEVFGESE